jgi:cysteinyl-tRNA synthetase
MAPQFYNTLTGKKEEFSTIKKGEVKMYNCGPTVYGVQHIGNLSMFVFTDVLRRTLEYGGLKVKQVINITDFGHLSGDNQGDADIGEDRMSKGLRQAGMELTLKNMRVLAEKYATIWKSDLKKLGIETDSITFPFASDYIPEQIDMIQTLEEKGFAYKETDGVYFDTSKFPDYGKLGNINLEGLKTGARIEHKDEKRNPTDFLLWKSDSKIGWESPWGRGFPGWHIECSAMIYKLLGEQIDIHTGGIEHIPIHHNNEIAQSESATGKKPFSRFWLHRAHLKINSGKISKSEGNTVYLSEIIERGFDPLSFRFLLLMSHYRTGANFIWEALEGAETALKRLYGLYIGLGEVSAGQVSNKYRQEFKTYVEDDLDTPRALALLWDVLKGEQLSPADKKATILDFDKVFGLGFADLKEEIIPEEVIHLLKQRQDARENKHYKLSDDLRVEINRLGYEVKDTNDGQKVSKI